MGSVIRGPFVALLAILALGTAARAPAAGDPERDAFFGETHVHTS